MMSVSSNVSSENEGPVAAMHIENADSHAVGAGAGLLTPTPSPQGLKRLLPDVPTSDLVFHDDRLDTAANNSGFVVPRLLPKSLRNPARESPSMENRREVIFTLSDWTSTCTEIVFNFSYEEYVDWLEFPTIEEQRCRDILEQEHAKLLSRIESDEGVVGKGTFGTLMSSTNGLEVLKTTCVESIRPEETAKIWWNRTRQNLLSMRQEFCAVQKVGSLRICRATEHHIHPDGLTCTNVYPRMYGDVHKWIEEMGELSYGQMYVFMRDIVEALAACHAVNLVHLDIKPANILVKIEYYKMGDKPENWKLSFHLADFGAAEWAGHGSVVRGGTSIYMPPETADHNTHTSVHSSQDVYALGVTLMELRNERGMRDWCITPMVRIARAMEMAATEPWKLWGGLLRCDPKERLTVNNVRFLLSKMDEFTMFPSCIVW